MRVFSSIMVFALVGCGAGVQQPAFPDLHPIKGTVRVNGKTVSGGVVVLVPDPPKDDFMINSEVGTDGTFQFKTVRLTDSQGERKPGVAPGKYKGTYTPKLGDQTTGGAGGGIPFPSPITVSGPNEKLQIDLNPGKK